MTAPRRRLPLRLAPALLAATAFAPMVAAADDAPRQNPREHGGREHERRADHRALADAVRRVERATGGEVLSAERVPFDGRDVNRVKVVDASGRVRIYMDDPKPRQNGGGRTRGDDGAND